MAASSGFGEMARLREIAASLGIPVGSEGRPPASRFLDANGLRMHCLDWDHADRPALVFLHGAMLTAHTWDLVCLSLREDFHCLCLDQRGHGLTDEVHAFGVEQPAEDIRAAIAGLGLTRFVVVGMSMGGNNAIAYAGTRPPGLAGLVLVDVCPQVLPAGYKDAMVYSAAIGQARSLDEAVEIAWAHNPRGSKAFKRHTLGHSLEPGEDGHWRLRSERERADPALHSAERMQQRRERLAALATRIECPVLLLHGSDSLAQSHDNLARFAETLGDARLVEIAGASHDVQEDQPLAVVRALRAFLGEIGFAD